LNVTAVLVHLFYSLLFNVFHYRGIYSATYTDYNSGEIQAE